MALFLMKHVARSCLNLVERKSTAMSIISLRNQSNICMISINDHYNTVDNYKKRNNFIVNKFYSTKYVKPETNYRSDSDSDSDSDREINKRNRGDSEFWRRKMRTLHGLLDVNNDGVISYDDFRLLADKFSALGHLTIDAYTEFQDVLKTTWEEQWGEITPYNLVTVEQYLADMHHVLNDKDLKKKVHRFLPYIFKAIDKDHSGYISLTEFKLFFLCLGLTEEDAAVSFAIIDKNGDGKLSMKEFVKLGKEFFLTENEKNISRMFWGPLVEH